MDKITVRELELKARVGTTAAERTRSQRLVITIHLELSLAAAGGADDLRATVPYDGIVDLVRKEATCREYNLVEAVAESVASAILSHRWAKKVTVEVRKFSVPKTRWVSVEVCRA